MPDTKPDLKLLSFPDRPAPKTPADDQADVIRFCREIAERVEKGELKVVRFLALIHAETAEDGVLDTESYAVVNDYERVVMLELDRLRILNRITGN